MAQIDALFREMKERGASDLHMVIGFPPLLRMRGELVPTEHPVLTPESNRGCSMKFFRLSSRRTWRKTGTWILPMKLRRSPGSAAIFSISSAGWGRCFALSPPIS